MLHVCGTLLEACNLEFVHWNCIRVGCLVMHNFSCEVAKMEIVEDYERLRSMWTDCSFSVCTHYSQLLRWQLELQYHLTRHTVSYYRQGSWSCTIISPGTQWARQGSWSCNITSPGTQWARQGSWSYTIISPGTQWARQGSWSCTVISPGTQWARQGISRKKEQL